MATGALELRVTDTLDEPVAGRLDMDFDPASGSVGGASSNVSFTLTGATDLTVSNLSARGGPGTRYEVRLDHSHFKTYAFFQVIVEKITSQAADFPIRLVVNPSAVRDIDAPGFDDLPKTLREFLRDARMQIGDKKFEGEDKELLGLAGAALYDALGPLRTACLLNLFTKSRHLSAAKVWSRILHPLVVRQDRCFCAVAPDTAAFLNDAERFTSAPKLLHKPLKGYELVSSFKSKDAHANLQVTVMTNTSTGDFAADVDIDEASGLGHGLEVIRNQFKGRTNPYLVRELLLLSEAEKGALDPGYRFVFKR